MRCGLNKPVRNNMTMFIGLKIDEESTETIYRWLQRCARDRDMELQAPLPKRFIYIPLCYSGSNALNEDELRSHLAGKINVPINLKNLQINFLGERGNVSLIFQSDWIKERYQFWISKDRRLRQRNGSKFKSRIPMSHFCHSCNHNWLKDLPIREIKLVEEFAIPFDRESFLREVKEEMIGWLK